MGIINRRDFSQHWSNEAPNFLRVFGPLEEWFKKEQKKEVKDIQISIEDPETMLHTVTVMCRDMRNGMREDWVVLVSREALLVSSPHFSEYRWRKVYFDAPQENQHDWGRNKDGIVVCHACGEIRGFKNEKYFCPATVKALPAPDKEDGTVLKFNKWESADIDNGTEDDTSKTIAQEDVDSGLME
jgi:hypothetical protein